MGGDKGGAVSGGSGDDTRDAALSPSSGGELGPDDVCRRSEDVVSREISGELIIVPLVAGIGDMDEELFTLNETGRAVWRRLDGERTLGEVAAELAAVYEAGEDEVRADVVGLVGELVQRRMVVVVGRG